MNEPLSNARHEHFAQLIAGGEDVSRAYEIAGYKGAGAAQSGRRLAKNAQIARRIAQLRASVEQPSRERAIEKAAVNKAWVLANLTKIAEMGMTATPVKDRYGKPIGEYKTNLAAANRALELVGKELGMFVERHEDVTKTALDGLSRDELKALRDELRAFLAATQPPAASATGEPERRPTTH